MNYEMYSRRADKITAHNDAIVRCKDMLIGLGQREACRLLRPVLWRSFLEFSLLSQEASAAGCLPHADIEKQRETFLGDLEQLGGLMGEW